ncbi:MAG: hypothetical protein ACOCXH_06910 [Cyclobacteriaceae bacterium]
MEKRKHVPTNANKKRIIKSYEKLAPELQDLLNKKYPYGYSNQLIRLANSQGENYFAVPLETEDTVYMVKVHIGKVKKQKNADDEFHFSLGEEGDDYTTSDDPLSDDYDNESSDGNDPSYNPKYGEDED